MSPLLLAVALGCATARVGPESAAVAAPLERRRYAPEQDGEPLRAGVAYGPHRDGQRPGGPDPSPEQIREDLEIIAGHWGVLRTYGSRGPTPVVVETIAREQLPLRVVVGAWIDVDDLAANQAEVDAAIELALRYPDHVVAVAVGNETQVSWAAHRSPVEPLVEHLRAVRAAVPQPVTTADDYSYWLTPESRAVAAEVDFLMVHAHPLWNGQQLADGVRWTEATLDAVQAQHPGLPMVLGEVGWATSHDPAAAEGAHIRGATGEAEQAAFLAAFTPWAEARGLPYFWFEAFDERWKGGDSDAEVEKHWGLYRADRTPKAAASAAGAAQGAAHAD